MECLRQECLPGQKEEEENGKGETTSCGLVVRGNWGRNFLFGVCVVVEVKKKIKSGALLGVVVACSVSCLQRPACHEHWAKNTSLQDTILSLLSAPSSSSCFGHACI